MTTNKLAELLVNVSRWRTRLDKAVAASTNTIFGGWEKGTGLPMPKDCHRKRTYRNRRRFAAVWYAHRGLQRATEKLLAV